MPMRTNGSRPIERSRSVIMIPTACQCPRETSFLEFFISPLRAMAPMGLQGTAFTRLSLLGPVLAVLDVSFAYACISDRLWLLWAQTEVCCSKKPKKFLLFTDFRKYPSSSRSAIPDSDVAPINISLRC